MIDAKDLRVGNWVTDEFYEHFKTVIKVSSINEAGINLEVADDGNISELANHYIEPEYSFEKIYPIKLTPEILKKAWFKTLPHFTVQNSYNIDAGRGRVISVACVGTPNEMVFLNEEDPPQVKAVIVVRNFDYDGNTYLHHLQNIYHSITNKELPIQL